MRPSGRVADLLHVEKRRRLLECVLENPGVGIRDLADRNGVATGTAAYHLTVLTRAGLVVERAAFSKRLFFPGRDCPLGWQGRALLREGPMKLLHGWLVMHPRAPQREILRAMQTLHGWSRSTAQHRLARLCQAGLAGWQAEGRFKRYTVPQPLAGSPRHPTQPQERLRAVQALAASTSTSKAS